MANRKASIGQDEQSLNTDLHMLDLPHADFPFPKPVRARDQSPLAPKSFTQNVSRSSLKNGRQVPMKNLMVKKQEKNNIKILVIPSHGSLFQKENDPRSSNDHDTRSNNPSPRNGTCSSYRIKTGLELERSMSVTEEGGFNKINLQENTRGIKTQQGTRPGNALMGPSSGHFQNTMFKQDQVMSYESQQLEEPYKNYQQRVLKLRQQTKVTSLNKKSINSGGLGASSGSSPFLRPQYSKLNRSQISAWPKKQEAKVGFGLNQDLIQTTPELKRPFIKKIERFFPTTELKRKSLSLALPMQKRKEKRDFVNHTKPNMQVNTLIVNSQSIQGSYAKKTIENFRKERNLRPRNPSRLTKDRYPSKIKEVMNEDIEDIVNGTVLNSNADVTERDALNDPMYASSLGEALKQSVEVESLPGQTPKQKGMKNTETLFLQHDTKYDQDTEIQMISVGQKSVASQSDLKYVITEEGGQEKAKEDSSKADRLAKTPVTEAKLEIPSRLESKKASNKPSPKNGKRRVSNQLPAKKLPYHLKSVTIELDSQLGLASTPVLPKQAQSSFLNNNQSLMGSKPFDLFQQSKLMGQTVGSNFFAGAQLSSTSAAAFSKTTGNFNPKPMNASVQTSVEGLESKSSIPLRPMLSQVKSSYSKENYITDSDLDIIGVPPPLLMKPPKTAAEQDKLKSQFVSIQNYPMERVIENTLKESTHNFSQNSLGYLTKGKFESQNYFYQISRQLNLESTQTEDFHLGPDTAVQTKVNMGEQVVTEMEQPSVKQESPRMTFEDQNGLTERDANEFFLENPSLDKNDRQAHSQPPEAAETETPDLKPGQKQKRKSIFKLQNDPSSGATTQKVSPSNAEADYPRKSLPESRSVSRQLQESAPGIKHAFLQTGDGKYQKQVAIFGAGGKSTVTIPHAQTKGGNSNQSVGETEELYRHLSSSQLRRHPLPDSSSFQSHGETTEANGQSKSLNFKNRVKTQHKMEASQSTSHLEAKSLMSLNQIAHIGDRNVQQANQLRHPVDSFSIYKMSVGQKQSQADSLITFSFNQNRNEQASEKGGRNIKLDLTQSHFSQQQKSQQKQDKSKDSYRALKQNEVTLENLLECQKIKNPLNLNPQMQQKMLAQQGQNKRMLSQKNNPYLKKRAGNGSQPREKKKFTISQLKTKSIDHHHSVSQGLNPNYFDKFSSKNPYAHSSGRRDGRSPSSDIKKTDEIKASTRRVSNRETEADAPKMLENKRQIPIEHNRDSSKNPSMEGETVIESQDCLAEAKMAFIGDSTTINQSILVNNPRNKLRGSKTRQGTRLQNDSRLRIILQDFEGDEAITDRDNSKNIQKMLKTVSQGGDESCGEFNIGNIDSADIIGKRNTRLQGDSVYLSHLSNTKSSAYEGTPLISRIKVKRGFKDRGVKAHLRPSQKTSSETVINITEIREKAQDFDQSILYLGKFTNNPNLQNLCQISQQLSHKKNCWGSATLEARAGSLEPSTGPSNFAGLYNSIQPGNSAIKQSLKQQTITNTNSTILQLHKSLGQDSSPNNSISVNRVLLGKFLQKRKQSDAEPQEKRVKHLQAKARMLIPESILPQMSQAHSRALKKDYLRRSQEKKQNMKEAGPLKEMQEVSKRLGPKPEVRRSLGRKDRLTNSQINMKSVMTQY